MNAGFIVRRSLPGLDFSPTAQSLRPLPLHSTRRALRTLRPFLIAVAVAAALTVAVASAAAKGVTAWGNNDDGQLNVPAGLNAIAVSGGASHSLALKADGTVVGWGFNGYGAASVPPGLTGVSAISAGANHSLALKSDGTVVGWGYNFYGAASVPPGLTNVKAIDAGGYHSVALKTDGTVVAWGYNGYGETTIPAGLKDVVAIGAGAYHSVALKSDGTVVAWGYNFFGVATVPDGLKNVVAIAAGDYHTLALKTDGTVVGWGYNTNGGVTIPSSARSVVSIGAGAYHSVAVKSDGTMVAWGYNGSGVGTVPPGLTKIVGVCAGSYHNLALFTPPEPPVAIAGNDRHVSEGTFINLDGSASSDPNSPPRALINPVWTQTGGPAVQLSNSNSLVASFVAPTVPPSGAVLTFAFSVSNGAATSTSTVNINVDNINQAPTANAGPAQTVNEKTIVTLQGDGRDADGDRLTLTWVQTGGPLVILDGADTALASFVAPAVSTAEGSVQLSFRLTVNDGFVSSGPSEVSVRVLNTNDAPIANGGGDKSVNETELVALNGSGSHDPNNDALTYAWTQIDGTPLVTLSGADTATASFAAPEVAFGGSTLTFKLTVSDGELTDSNVVSVRINNVNHAPLADAGLDQTSPENALVTLDGADSADLDGDSLTFAWTQTDGPLVKLVGATSATPTFTAPDVNADGATLIFNLTVDDGYGGATSDEVRVNVQFVNRPPTANAGADQVPTENSLVTLDGTGSDPDNNALGFSWTQISGPLVELSDQYSGNPTFVAPAVTRAEDDVVFQLKVSDPYGGTATDDVTIHIANINHAPIAQAPGNLSVAENQLVNLIGAGTDPDAEEQNQLVCVWQQIAGPAVVLTGNGANVSFTAPQVTAGGDPNAKATLTFKLTMSDPNQAVGQDEVDIVVTNLDHSPTANAGGNVTTNEGTSVTLNGSASSDPDGDALNYSWVQTDGPAVTLNEANTAYPHFAAPFVTGAGLTLKFALTVDDGFGGNSTDTASVTITNVNEPPNSGNVRPSVAVLWPPNHRMVPVSLLGISASPLAKVTITGVTQDEPTYSSDDRDGSDGKGKSDKGKGKGDKGKGRDDAADFGKNDKRDSKKARQQARSEERHSRGDKRGHGRNHDGSDDADDDDDDDGDDNDKGSAGEVDAIINEDGTVLLRAERDGNGDGRVYTISFTVTDFEAITSGTVQVMVPHSRKTSTAIDNGGSFDSCVPTPRTK